MNEKQEKAVKRMFEAMHKTYEDWYQTKRGIFAYGHDWKTQQQEVFQVFGLNSIITLEKV